MRLRLSAQAEHRPRDIRRTFQRSPSVSSWNSLGFRFLAAPRVVGLAERSPVSRWAASRWCSSTKKQDRWERVRHVLRKAHQSELVSKNLYRNPIAFFVSKLSLPLNLPDNCVHLRGLNLSWQPYQKVVSIPLCVLQLDSHLFTA